MPLISCSAKWILCGEHSVIRGGKAIAFPLHNFSNSIFFEKGDNLFIEDSYSKDTILTLLKIGCDFFGVSVKKISGHLLIKSNIPHQSGLGSSAALCSNIAKLFQYCGCCGDLFEFAKRLENEFHKKSSGSDVAVILENKPIIFNDNKIAEFFKPEFWPPMLLTHSGEKSSTSDCVSIVNDFFSKNEKLALESDQQMNLAANMCENALKKADFNKLKDGIMLGNDVFRQWGLYTASMSFYVEKLLSAGAVAAKPIGSGLGGYIVSLWEEEPAHMEYSLLLSNQNSGTFSGKEKEI
jgi:mevalonate kinase